MSLTLSQEERFEVKSAQQKEQTVGFALRALKAEMKLAEIAVQQVKEENLALMLRLSAARGIETAEAQLFEEGDSMRFVVK